MQRTRAGQFTNKTQINEIYLLIFWAGFIALAIASLMGVMMGGE